MGPQVSPRLTAKGDSTRTARGLWGWHRSSPPPLTLVGEEGAFLEGQCRDSLRNRWILLQPEKRVEVKFKGWCD